MEKDTKFKELAKILGVDTDLLWNELHNSYDEVIAAITTFEKAASIYYNSAEGSERSSLALAKMTELGKKQLPNAKFSEAWFIMCQAPDDSELHSLAVVRVIEITRQQLPTATFDEACNIYYNDAPRDSEIREVRRLALARMTELGIQHLPTATFNEAYNTYYKRSPIGSELRVAAVNRMLELI
jgi:hypothetical protein